MNEKAQEKNTSSEDLPSEADELFAKLEHAAKPADVLIVDDVYANVYLMENILNERYTVKGLSTAEGMWRYLKTHTPRIILLDLMIPYENGFEILQKLKADPAYRAIPVIVVSAKDAKADVVKVLSLGAVGYIVKPVEEHSLMSKVMKALGDKDEETVQNLSL